MFCMILSGFPLIFCLFCSVSDGKSCFSVRKSISTSERQAEHPFAGRNTQQRTLFCVQIIESRLTSKRNWNLWTEFRICVWSENYVANVSPIVSDRVCKMFESSPEISRHDLEECATLRSRLSPSRVVSGCWKNNFC